MTDTDTVLETDEDLKHQYYVLMEFEDKHQSKKALALFYQSHLP